MDSSRREVIGAGAALAALGIGEAQAQGAPPAGGPVSPTGAPVSGATVMPKATLRLVCFAARPTDPPRLGMVTMDGHVIDLSAQKGLGFDAGSMLSLIGAGPAALDEIRKLARAHPEGPALDKVHLFAPIPRPTRNVYAVGWNYLEHFEEGQATRGTKAEYSKHPVFFTKAVGTVNGPNDTIPYDPAVSTAIDWECELAVVIGRRGINIPESEAMSHVFGYTVINDTTARDIQIKLHGGQWFKGKSLDGHGPIGPWIIPAAELDPGDLKLQLRVNGAVKQDASTKQMYFKVPRIIAELSLGMALEPGDIIATGTPPGVGNARTPPEFLKPGDVMETEIAEIGTLRNVIQQVKA